MYVIFVLKTEYRRTGKQLSNNMSILKIHELHPVFEKFIYTVWFEEIEELEDRRKKILSLTVVVSTGKNFVY